MLSLLKKESILVLGYGEEGQDSFEFLRKNFPKKTIGIADLNIKQINDKNVDLYFGKNYLKAIKKYKVIIKSPGIKQSILEEYKKDKIITNQADIFLSLNKGTVIGVTGTKGKTTTCLALYNLLKTKREDVFLVGNIGTPALNFLGKEGIFIYELSSFQLQNVTKSPQIAILLNIFKDHLDHHTDFNDYLSAKKNITRFQKESDILIYNQDDENILKIINKSKAQKISFNPEKRLNQTAVYMDTILKVAPLFNISKNEVLKSIRKLSIISNRMEYCGNFSEINFYNDSAATIPEATIEAIKIIRKIDTIIIGGVDKGGDYRSLSEKLKNSQIRNILLFPETGYKIAKNLNDCQKNIQLVKSMDEAVCLAYKFTKKGNSCLLSPASSSFNMFLNYKDRGDRFKKAIKKYA